MATKPVFSLPTSAGPIATKELLDGEVNRIVTGLWDELSTVTAAIQKGSVQVITAAAGGPNAYTSTTLDPAQIAGTYPIRTVFSFTPSAANTGPVTIVIAGVTYSLRGLLGGELAAGDLAAGSPVLMFRTASTQLRLVSLLKSEVLANLGTGFATKDALRKLSVVDAGTTTGTASAYISPALPADYGSTTLASTGSLAVRFHATNAASATLSVGGEVLALQSAAGVPVTAGVIRANEQVLLMRAGTALRLMTVSQAEVSELTAHSMGAIANGFAGYLGTLNIFDPNSPDIVLDQNIVNGTFVERVGHFVTGWMPVKPGGKIISNTTQSGMSSGRAWNFFDRNRNFISAIAGGHVAGVAYDVPANAVWARTNYQFALPPKNIMIVADSTLPAEFIPYGIPALEPEMVAAAQYSHAARCNDMANLFDPSQRTDGFIIRNTGVTEANSNVCYTGYIPVMPGGKFTVHPASMGFSGNSRGMCFYDKYKNVVPGAPLAPWGDHFVVDVPKGVYYVRISFHKDHIKTLTVFAGERTSGHPATHRVAMMSDVQPWYGRKFAVLGDSISNQYNWLLDLTNKLGADVGLRAAMDGRGMADALRTSDNTRELIADDFANIDATILWLGTNNFLDLGTIADPTSANTFFGHSKRVIEQILTWKPAMMLVLGTVMWRTTMSYHQARSQALRDLADLYTLPIIDFERRSGVNAFSHTYMLKDGVHPTPLGYSAGVVPAAMAVFRQLVPRT